MMIILHGGMVDKLTFIPSEFKATLAGTNSSLIGYTLKLHQCCIHNIDVDLGPLTNILTMLLIIYKQPLTIISHLCLESS